MSEIIKIAREIAKEGYLDKVNESHLLNLERISNQRASNLMEAHKANDILKEQLRILSAKFDTHVLMPKEPTKEILDAYNQIDNWLKNSPDGVKYAIRASYENSIGEPYYKAIILTQVTDKS